MADVKYRTLNEDEKGMRCPKDCGCVGRCRIEAGLYPYPDTIMHRMTKAIGDCLYGYIDPNDTPNTWGASEEAATAVFQTFGATKEALPISFDRNLLTHEITWKFANEAQAEAFIKAVRIMIELALEG